MNTYRVWIRNVEGVNVSRDIQAVDEATARTQALAQKPDTWIDVWVSSVEVLDEPS